MPRKSERKPKPNPKYQEEKKTPKKLAIVKDIKTKKQEKKEVQNEILEKKKEKVIQTKKKQEEEELVKVILNNKIQKQLRLEELYIPDDEITKNINKSLIKLKVLFAEKNTSFPDSFVNGTQVLEVKPQDYQSPKVILWSKFKNGEYHTADSKSDVAKDKKGGIWSVIKSITNNLPSFKQYKDVEDLSWIINNHRQLFLEMIEHIANNKLAPSTLKSYINVILRISRLGYNSKSSTIYTKYSTIMDDISKSNNNKEKQQGLNEIEKTKYLGWEHVMIKRNTIEKEFNEYKSDPLKKKEAFEKNQDLILTSLYTLTPVLRREIATLKFTEKKPKDKQGDYVYFHPKGGVSLELYEMKKRHGYISIPLNYREENNPSGISKFILKNQIYLAKLLKESADLYKRDYIFINRTKYNKDGTIEAVTADTTAKRLEKIYKEYGVKVGASSLRSSYITYLNNLFIKLTGNVLTTAEQDEIAVKYMRTSRNQFDTAYCKIFRNSNVFEIPLDVIAINDINKNDNANVIREAILVDDNNNEIQVKKENEVIDHLDEDLGYEREELQTKLTIPAYDKHLERVKKAYNNSKEIEVTDEDGKVRVTTEAREQKRLYFYKRDKFEMNRKKILREYHSATKLRNLTQATINKYKFTEEELKRKV